MCGAQDSKPLAKRLAGVLRPRNEFRPFRFFREKSFYERPVLLIVDSARMFLRDHNSLVELISILSAWGSDTRTRRCSYISYVFGSQARGPRLWWTEKRRWRRQEGRSEHRTPMWGGGGRRMIDPEFGLLENENLRKGRSAFM